VSRAPARAGGGSARGDVARRTERQRVGDEGERAAALFLEGLGYRIVARNHRTRRGEVDLIVELGDTLAFVEVRTRADDRFGAPEETVDGRKQARLVAAARDFLLGWRGPERAIRFDVVAVTGGRLRHLPGAFDAGV
jgi:putative endonuclease